MLAYEIRSSSVFMCGSALLHRKSYPQVGFSLLFSVQDAGPERRSLLLNVCGSHNGKGVYLVVSWYDFSWSPLIAVIWLMRPRYLHDKHPRSGLRWGLPIFQRERKIARISERSPAGSHHLLVQEGTPELVAEVQGEGRMSPLHVRERSGKLGIAR